MCRLCINFLSFHFIELKKNNCDKNQQSGIAIIIIMIGSRNSKLLGCNCQWSMANVRQFKYKNEQQRRPHVGWRWIFNDINNKYRVVHIILASIWLSRLCVCACVRALFWHNFWSQSSEIYFICMAPWLSEFIDWIMRKPIKTVTDCSRSP